MFNNTFHRVLVVAATVLAFDGAFCSDAIQSQTGEASTATTQAQTLQTYEQRFAEVSALSSPSRNRLNALTALETECRQQRDMILAHTNLSLTKCRRLTIRLLLILALRKKQLFSVK